MSKAENNKSAAEKPESGKYYLNDYDSGFVSDESLITLLKPQNNLSVISNTLLGSFKENGQYELSLEVKREITDMPKIGSRRVEISAALTAVAV